MKSWVVGFSLLASTCLASSAFADTVTLFDEPAAG